MNLEILDKAAGKAVNRSNAAAVLSSLAEYGPKVGLTVPHRVVPYLSQLMHESGRFRYDHELWGPTPAQRRYEGRKDLGNVHKGDGYKFRGRGPIQVTGRANHAEFTAWVRKYIDPDGPDFTEEPELLLSDPWEGLAPIWYWSTRKLNRYADNGDNEMITRRINGGLNGYEDRLNLYTDVGIATLGFDTVKSFQKSVPSLKADGISGPATRKAIHKALVALSSVPEVHPIHHKVTALEARVEALEKAARETEV